MDDDLNSMNKDDLVKEVIKLRQAIRKHRDCQGHNLCWYHPEMWKLLPESTTIDKEVPPWGEFLSGCIQYRTSLDKEKT